MKRQANLPGMPHLPGPQVDKLQRCCSASPCNASTKLENASTSEAITVTGSGRARKRRKIDPSTSKSAPVLCEQCKLLDLDKSFVQAHDFYEKARRGIIRRRPALYGETDEGPFFYVDAFFVHGFGDRLSRPSDCRLCQFFAALRVQAESHERHKLLAFCSSEGASFSLSVLKESAAWNKVEHTVFMAVVPDQKHYPSHGHGETWLEDEIPKVGAIYRLRRDKLPGVSGTNSNDDDDDHDHDEGLPPLLQSREMGDAVDFSLPREWLSFCRAHHGEACNRPDPQLRPVSRGFRVIDCSLQPPQVIAACWGVAYAALSYVWGQRPEDLVSWPRTVLDAVTVTRELGLQFLWVDRLCINQSDDEEKAYLISKMTDIYEGADFTIVAAAGSGASRGLPGVTAFGHGDSAKQTRKAQPKFELESGNILVSALQDPRLEIINSEHWTRGWTYQEGILSGRRLVFTESQVYWECRCMAIHESVEMPLRHLHEPCSQDGNGGMRMADYMRSGIFQGGSHSNGAVDDNKENHVSTDASRLEYGFPNHGGASIRAQLRGLDDHIRAFSCRKLSHDGDSLAAFLGIVGMYKSTEGLYLYLGLPIWMPDILGDLTGAYISFALSVCSWYHRSASEHQMFVTEACRRRTHLPSWTWAGWQGTVTWRAPPTDEHSVIMGDLIESERLHLVWAADIYLRCVSKPVCVRLLNLYSAEVLDKEMPKLLEIRNPLVLKYARLHETQGNKWEWRRLAGRRSGKQYLAERQSWDKKWQRLAGRLTSINMSISVTEEEWSERHESGEYVSVLVFAAQFPTNSHGRARFITLRRDEDATSFETRWERIGTLQLTIPMKDLERCMTNDELLKRIPVQRRMGCLVIQ